MSGMGEVGDRGDPELELAGAERTAGLPEQAAGGRILLQEALQRSAAGGDDRCGLGGGHEPFRVGANHDVVRPLLLASGVNALSC